MAREHIPAERRFLLLQAAKFTCAWCGGKPGNDRLHLAHIVPHSRGGTEHSNNLVVACDRCNLGMGTLVSIPESMLTGEKDRSNWLIWKRFGGWIISWHPSRIDVDHGQLFVSTDECQLSITFERTGYWFSLDRCHEEWERHMARKGWLDREELMYFELCLEFVRTLVREGGGR
jgi:hypothetical protein